MPVFSLPAPLQPASFANSALYIQHKALKLYCAVAPGLPPAWFPKTVKGTARFDVPRFFGARYFSTDARTAEAEFKFHYGDEILCRISQVTVGLAACLDLDEFKTKQLLQLPAGFLEEQPYFPWHFLAACALSANADSVSHKSFRGAGTNFAIFQQPTIVQDFRPV